MKKILFLLVLFPLLSFSQLEKRIDSLENTILKSKDLRELDECYKILSGIYIDHDIEKARKVLKRYFKLSKDNQCARCEMKAFFLQGHLYDRLGKTNESVNSFEESANIALSIKDFLQFQRSYTWKIQILISNRTNYQIIEDELKKYETIATQHQIKEGWHEVYFLHALNYYQRGFLKKSIEYYIKGEKFVKDNKLDAPEFQMGVLNNIAQVYKELKEYTKTKSYVEQAMQEALKTKDSFNIMNIVLHKGVIETDFKNYHKALPHLEKSYSYYNKINNAHYKGSAALYLSIVYYRLNRFPEAEKYNSIAEKLYSDEYNQISLGETLAYKTLISIKTNQVNLAKESINQTNKIFENQKDNPTYPIVIESEIAYHIKLNNFKEALRLTHVKDSLRKILEENFNENQLNEIEAIYQTEKKEQEIKLLSAENKLAERQKYIYIALIVLLIFLGLTIFYLYRNKIKTANKISELNEMKSRFFANISHEFRTPLTLIKSPVQQLQATATDEKQKNQLNLVDKNADRMLELVDQLLELSKLDSGTFKLILKEGNLSDFLKSIAEPFAFQANENNLYFHTEIQTGNQNHFFDKDVTQKIVSNLLSNALKYTPENHSIHFSSSIEKDNLLLSVSNSGVKLKKEELPKLFERFYQKTDAQSGVGIGLALVKELVDLYQGNISTSLDNDKLTFNLSLPLTVSKDENILIATEQLQLTKNSSETDEELPILLIVDDNAEIRAVLYDLFSEEYRIIEAGDGETALRLAQQEIPDCIISDVMMPKVDGFAFTKEIKSNELTSFVPVILLTAKTSEEAHLEALKSTADAFLTKPFNHNIVKATVYQLISERKKLQQRYSQELILKPVDIVINSVDEKFLQKLQTILDTQLANADFTAEEFAAQIGISRMQLHRKLKSLFDVSATEFIRNERLKNAAELLKKGNGNISEIAYSVGFNEISYFSRCFKDHFGCTPTDYAEKNN